jgi:cyclophilin family peptidyl-prolyl cis-trans isomerase/protein-disulfide isomerase
MKHRLIPGLMLLMVALVACGGSAAAPTATVQPPAQSTPTIAAPPAVVATAPAAATPAPTPDIEKIINPQPDDWSRGPQTAKITIIEWGDFQCPYCALVAPTLKHLTDAFPNDIRAVFRHFPLPNHPLSFLAAEASEAAGAQGKFWEMESWLYDKQQDWTGQTLDVFRKTLSEYAQQVGLDVKKFDADLDQHTYKPKVQAALDIAEQIGLGGTPFLLINKESWINQINYTSYDILTPIVQYYLKRYDKPPTMQIDQSKTYTATIKTDQGDIVVKLFADKAPLAVNNFVFLAKDGWYDGVTFHRVITDFVAQGGDPTGLGIGTPGYQFDNEVTGLKFDKAGLVAMANAGATPDGKGTNGSQFFITFGPTPQLDAADPAKEAKYTIFGEVISGMDVVNKLVKRDPQNTPNVAASVIKTIVIEEK